MIFKTRCQPRFRVIVVTSMIAIMSLWANVATAGLNDDLIIAAEWGDINAVKSSIAEGSDINAVESKEGVTAMMAASENGHLAVVQVLLVN
jgi:ankyrin repeat protein